MADQDNVNDHITNALFGGKQTKPDERRHYLGSLRERVELRITNDALSDQTTVWNFRMALPKYKGKPNLTVLINGKLGMGITGPYIKLCSENNLKFTLINDRTALLGADDSGLLIVAPDAVNFPDDQIALVDTTKKPQKEHKGLFGKLFH